MRFRRSGREIRRERWRDVSSSSAREVRVEEEERKRAWRIEGELKCVARVRVSRWKRE